MPVRSLLAQLRRPGGRSRGWLGVVLALALALKLLVPQGWMPGPGGLVLCPEATPTAHAGIHGGGKEKPGHALPDHPCAFAGLGLAAAPVLPVFTVASPPVILAGITPSRYVVAIGRGLAAPPPPATGPPPFA